MRFSSWSGLALVAATVVVLGANTAQARPEVEAARGRPFGVAKVTVPVGAIENAAPGTVPLALDDPDRRALYPTFSSGLLRRLLGGILGNDGARPQGEATAYFLFRGDTPFRVTFYTPAPVTVLVEPATNPNMFERLRTQWWREYNATVRQQEKDGDYSPLVETYLTSMLGRRMGLEPPLLSRTQEAASDQLQQTLELLAGTENLQTAMIRQALLGTPKGEESASLPVPPEVSWAALELPAGAEKVDVEPLALRVPEECFYIRFGRFNNYLWLKKLIEENGGDLSRMITLRGIDPQLSKRVEKRLALKENALAQLLGERVISDIALIGRDTYMQDGPAMGVLFQARNTDLLKADIERQRAEALKEDEVQGTRQEIVEIAGRKVSFLSSPSGVRRSFYASEGDYHLVTTSRAIVERFFAVAKGEGSLGNSAEFRHARTIMPTSRNDTVFVYLSTSFLRGLVSPQYQIERQRRLASLVDMQLLQLAQLAAAGEGKPAERIDDLFDAGLLPTSFGRRADGSRLTVERSEYVDSVRGHRGAMTPIPDLPLAGVTPSESAWHTARATYYAREWRQMDPLMVGIRRYAASKEGKAVEGRERIAIDAHVSPFVSGKYGWITSVLGPPTRQHLTPDAGDVIHISAMTQGGMLDPNVTPHIMFVGVQNAAPLGDLMGSGGFMQTLRILQATPGYLGSWPKTGFIDRLPLGLAGTQPDENGYSKLLFGLWRRQVGDFSVLSFDPKLLGDVTSRLRVAEFENASQVRVFAGDLSASGAAGWVNALAYVRARQASEGNGKLLATLNQQLHVPPKDALATAETLLDGKLICSLGGEYKLKEFKSGHGYWVSDRWTTAASAEGYRVPSDFQAPVLAWFRGLEAELAMHGDRVVLHGDLDLQRKADEKAPTDLPLFNLFGPKKDTGAKPKETLPPPPEKKGKEF